MWNPLRQKNKIYNLGIDIGTSSIKLVELLHDGNNIKLNNYAQFFPKSDYIDNSSGSLNLLDFQIAEALKNMFSETDFASGKAVLGLPVFSSFSTLIELPAMSDAELKDAIGYEVRKYIPVPISEVQFDWTKIEALSDENKFKVLTVAVPNEIIEKYNRIAQMVNINLTTMELETFSSARALVSQSSQENIAILDLGYRTTNVSIISGGIVIIHHNVDAGGSGITRGLAQAMSVDLQRAEEIKKTSGVSATENNVSGILKNYIDKILMEAEQVFQNYIQEGGKKITRIILTGGGALMPGFADYVKEVFSVETEIANPFKAIEVPSQLKRKLEKESPGFAVAVGLALRK
ncbi:MAG: hypothetical protein A3H51_01400 [Candidatus Spechtbacteria bacterium RIFCSPLOWO2_02_FULL_38_8]|uniref:SHS2 domain-containing protein n=1 Tax=Candidatus Spechtbacteria bacterium RIFCSPLOWO2_02_FULL_38_8 TaxID=1802164 RepID=A0A1G2HK16_9BACT|nr:MAG: hypothetical protein A3H51_01400 [Candidatus Spechtbacteria bacterium RIFCSPLOWO2_02_FULL_38_8]